MVLVEYWGCGARHTQLLLLAICGIVAAASIHTLENAMLMVELDTRTNNVTLFDDSFRQRVKSWTYEQKYILKNGSSVFRFIASLLAGLVTTRWNLKYFLLINCIFLSLLSYLIPVIANRTAYNYLLAVVLFQGFCYGMIGPMTTAILAKWTPYMEVGRTCTLVLSCQFIGNFCIYVLGQFLRTTLGGWHTLFYIVGNLGMLWCVAWFTFGFQEPRKCFYLSAREKEFIFSNIRYLSHAPLAQPIPWRGIFRCLPLYSVLISEVSHSWMYEMLTVTTLTSDYFYIHNNFTFPNAMTVRYAIPTGIPVVQFLAAFVVDAMIGRNSYPLSYIRKTCNTIGHWGSSLSLLWLCENPDGFLEVLFYFLFMYLNVFTNLGSKLVYYDITRDYSGFIQGLVGFVAFIPLAFFIPMMDPILPTKKVTDSVIETQYRRIFFTCASSTMLGNFVYIVMETRKKKLEVDGKPADRTTSMFKDH